MSDAPPPKRITAKQLAEKLLALPPKQREMEIGYADFSWAHEDEVQILEDDGTLYIIGG